MPYFSDGFKVRSIGSPMHSYPGKAHVWEDLNEVVRKYEEFLVECANTELEPMPLFIYIGMPSGDEEYYGYPDYPDYVVCQSQDNPIEVIVKVA